ncbi:MAG: hypothetical protein AAFY56_07700 [Pseudomonadota bacterium]
MSDPALTVAIYAPTDGESGEIGTGYPVSERLILTARHNVIFEGRDFGEKLEIGWADFDGDIRKRVWSQPAYATIKWQGPKDLDVVLLECEGPCPRNEWGTLSDTRLSSTQSCDLRGFAAAAAKRPDQTWDDFSGNAVKPGHGERHFTIEANVGVSDDEYWRGVSGAPVFVDGRIYGVISTAPKFRKSQVLMATAVWPLFEDDEFCRLLGRDELAIRIEKVRTIIEQSRNAKLLDELRAKLGLQSSSPFSLARHLCMLHDSDCLQSLIDFYRKQRQAEDEEGIALIEDLFQTTIPRLAEIEDIAKVRQSIFDPETPVLMVSPALHTMAELQLARLTRTSAHLSAPFEGEEWPWGQNALNIAGEVGRGTAQLQQDMMEQLEHALFEAQDPEEYEAFWKSILTARIFARDTMSYLKTPKKRATMLQKRLASLEEKGRSPYYAVIRRPETAGEFDDLRRKLQGLKKLVPNLVVIALDEENIFKDAEDLDPVLTFFNINR